MNEKLYRYRTCLLPSSRKKLLSLTKIMKNQKLTKIINYLDFYNKNYSFLIKKCLVSMLYHIKNIKKDDNYMQSSIRKVVIEERKLFYGIKYKGRGRIDRTRSKKSTLSIYIKNTN